jgi:hypothetical protein
MVVGVINTMLLVIAFSCSSFYGLSALSVSYVFTYALLIAPLTYYNVFKNCLNGRLVCSRVKAVFGYNLLLSVLLVVEINLLTGISLLLVAATTSLTVLFVSFYHLGYFRFI